MYRRSLHGRFDLKNEKHFSGHVVRYVDYCLCPPDLVLSEKL